jgi:putative ABC transport system permease protein
MAYVTPFIFLAVASLLVNIVLNRLVQQQKEQIAALRAFGYRRSELVIHYLKFLLVLVLLGATLGIVIGQRMSWWMTDTYAVFFRFPLVLHEFAIREALLAVGIGLAAAVLGGITALRKVVRLEPAVAMRPDPPQTFGGSILDRIGLGWSVSPIMRMIIRRLEANRLATSLSVLGIALGLAILVLGSFMEDTIAFVMDVQFGRAQRQDVMLTFNETLSASAAHDALHLPGVSRVEPFRNVGVRLRHGSRQYRLGLMGLEPQPALFRILNDKQRPIQFPEYQGLTVTQKLAELLDAKRGDELIVEILDSDREPQKLVISSIFPNFTDPAAYLNRNDLHRFMLEGQKLSGVFLTVDPTQLDELYLAVKDTPSVAGVLDNNAARTNFRQLIQENTRVMRLVNSIFGMIIAFGVLYNAALITLAESGRDLATLRVIGFSRNEVSSILVGEILVITLIAIPLGLPLGYGFSYLASLAIDTDSHRFPLIVSRSTFAYATVIILLSAAVSSLAVRRMLNHLDLLAVLKVKVS